MLKIKFVLLVFIFFDFERFVLFVIFGLERNLLSGKEVFNAWKFIYILLLMLY